LAAHAAFPLRETRCFLSQQAFLTTAFVLFCGGVVVFFGLVSCPSELGLPDPKENLPEATAGKLMQSLQEVEIKCKCMSLS